MEQQEYDVLIIGSGMGGLVCGSLLAKQGQSVCLLEKNRQLGGNLQVFARDKQLFDAGVHYLGSLAPGDNLYQLMQFLGIYDQLKLEQMDPDAFDKILVGDDPVAYPIAQGEANFAAQLSAYFPAEKKGIQEYLDRMRSVCARFPLYGLRSGDGTEKLPVMSDTAADVIAACVMDPTLRAVLAGNNLLYAGDVQTPFYVHALIENSYIRSAWKALDGGSQLVIAMARLIRKHRGTIVNHCQVTRLKEENGVIRYAEDQQGRRYYARTFISNIDPVATLAITDSALLRPLYRNRIKSLPNTISSFSIHLLLKEKTISYENSNYYYHRKGQLWNQSEYTQDDWPRGYALFFTRSRQDPDFAGSITIFTGMRYEECAPWAESFNTVSLPGNRGESYEKFKHKKATQLMDCVAERFPSLKAATEKLYSTSPLSYRDYIGTSDGNMYGFVRDADDPLKTQMSPKTKIPNLYLTGQNLNLHGILGTALSGILTCSVLLNDPGLPEKIRHA